MDHFIWTISYEPYHMDHIIWAISYGLYEALSYWPYSMTHTVWVISYGSQKLIHRLIPFERYASVTFCGPYFLVGRNLRNLQSNFISIIGRPKPRFLSRWKWEASWFQRWRWRHSRFLPRQLSNTSYKGLVKTFCTDGKTFLFYTNETDACGAAVRLDKRFQIFDHIWRWFFIENGQNFENWWHLVSSRYFEFISENQV